MGREREREREREKDEDGECAWGIPARQRVARRTSERALFERRGYTGCSAWSPVFVGRGREADEVEGFWWMVPRIF